MFNLYRAIYSRNGGCNGMTFACRRGLFAAEEAVDYAERVLLPYAKTLDPQATLLTVINVKSRHEKTR